jgi:hypothetical protein
MSTATPLTNHLFYFARAINETNGVISMSATDGFDIYRGYTNQRPTLANAAETLMGRGLKSVANGTVKFVVNEGGEDHTCRMHLMSLSHLYSRKSAGTLGIMNNDSLQTAQKWTTMAFLDYESEQAASIAVDNMLGSDENAPVFTTKHVREFLDKWQPGSEVPEGVWVNNGNGAYAITDGDGGCQDIIDEQGQLVPCPEETPSLEDLREEGTDYHENVIGFLDALNKVPGNTNGFSGPRAQKVPPRYQNSGIAFIFEMSRGEGDPNGLWRNPPRQQTESQAS